MIFTGLAPRVGSTGLDGALEIGNGSAFATGALSFFAGAVLAGSSFLQLQAIVSAAITVIESSLFIAFLQQDCSGAMVVWVGVGCKGLLGLSYER